MPSSTRPLALFLLAWVAVAALAVLVAFVAAQDEAHEAQGAPSTKADSIAARSACLSKLIVHLSRA